MRRSDEPKLEPFLKHRSFADAFKSLFENGDDAICILDIHERFIAINRRAHELTGFKGRNCIGQSFRNIVSDRSLPKAVEGFQNTIEGKAVILELELKTPTRKTPVVVEASLAPFVNRKKIVGAIGIVRDITDGRKIRASERMAHELSYERDLLQALMDNIPDTIYFKDTASRFTRINKAQARALGIEDPADAVGKTDFDFFGKEHSRNAYADEQRIVKTGLPLISKVEKIATSDDRLWWVSATKVPIKDKYGRVASIVGISRDITERMKMEEELKRYSEHLEELVDERTKELKEAQSQILKSERLAAIGQLAGMVGHDLRNPLTGIEGATYYLKKRYGNKMDTKAGEMLEIIEKDISYSNKIINDLLDYSREIKLELTQSNPKTITKEALSLVKIPKDVKIVDLTETKPEIKIDIDKMKRAFVNLIKNALDAMPGGGKLMITSKESMNHWKIAFSDTGKGMTKRMLESIWSPLFTTKAKGMGFGLAICKRIVEAHGGKLSVRSIVNRGTTFTLTIPIDPPEKKEELWTNLPEPLLSIAKKRDHDFAGEGRNTHTRAL
jgi:two-component system sensor histidine kinase/response regulator